MTISDEIEVLNRFEHVHNLAKSILTSADDRLLKSMLSELSSMEMAIWFEMDRRAGKPWAQAQQGAVCKNQSFACSSSSR